MADRRLEDGINEIKYIRSFTKSVFSLTVKWMNLDLCVGRWTRWQLGKPQTTRQSDTRMKIPTPSVEQQVALIYIYTHIKRWMRGNEVRATLPLLLKSVRGKNMSIKLLHFTPGKYKQSVTQFCQVAERFILLLNYSSDAHEGTSMNINEHPISSYR